MLTVIPKQAILKYNSTLMKIEVISWEKIFANCIPKEGLVSGIRKKLEKFSNEKKAT